MSWTFWMILLPTVCYLAACVGYLLQRNWPLAIVYAGYAFANTGLLWLDRITTG